MTPGKRALHLMRRAGFPAALALLAVAAAKARAIGLDPETLWHDDVWVGALTRASSIVTAVQVPSAAPPGFVAICWVMARLVADPELALQATPFVAGILGIFAAGWMGRALTGSPAAGVAVAALVVLNPLHAHFSVFVKQYTLEFLVLTALVAIMSSDRWLATDWRVAAVAAGALAAATLGTGAAVTLAIGVNLVVVWAIVQRRREGARAWPSAVIVLAFNLALAVYGLILVLPSAKPNVIAYWTGYYLPTSWPDARAFLGAQGRQALTGALPAGAGSLAWLAPVGLVALALRPRTRLVAVFALTLGLSVGVLSALERYPIGGGRTDMYSFPLTLACVVAGGAALLGFLPGERWSKGIIALGLFLLALLRAPGDRYFELDQAGLARLFEVSAVPGDGLVVYPPASYLIAFYTRLPVAPRYRPEESHWQMALTEPNALTLPYGDVARGREQLSGFLAQGRYQRVLYFGARASNDYPEADLFGVIEAAGYRERRRWTARIRTSFIIFERVGP